MKTSKFFGALLITLALIFSYTAVSATNAVPAKEIRRELVKKVLNQQSDVLIDKMTDAKVMKKVAKVAKFFGKKSGGDKIDFQTEPDRWMWFWLAGWAAGLLLGIFAVFVPAIWYISSLCWLAGTIFLIIWILKKTGNM
jgi:hypothetical protein